MTVFSLLKEQSFFILCSVSNTSMNTDFLKHAFTVCIALRPLTKVGVFFCVVCFGFFLKEQNTSSAQLWSVIKAEASCIFKNLWLAGSCLDIKTILKSMETKFGVFCQYLRITFCKSVIKKNNLAFVTRTCVKYEHDFLLELFL